MPRHSLLMLRRYKWGKKLGKGGFGQVKIVIEKSTGREWACKSICKKLDVPNFSPQKQAAHLDNIRREIAILRRLKGVLNVAQLKEALEDDKDIHIVMEYCRGGELWNCIGKRHYGEGTVASYMRAVLRTIAQCHANRILHRDVKPGNFMLLEDQPLTPVKAIDFGLAVFFEPGSLPRRDLGFEGTPWFMSPETLSSEVVPASDVWAAGVMAYQLLSGYLPFDDYKNRDQPALSKVWKAILTDQVSFKSSAWSGVPDLAKDFVKTLLNKDPTKRPTAQEALHHPWLLNRHKADRNCGAPLEHTVVQRIQRYGQGSVLKRSIFELIAQEIIKMAPEPPTPDSSQHSAGTSAAATNKQDAEEGSDTNHRTLQMLSNLKRRKSQRALGELLKGPGGGAMEGPPLIHRDHHSVHAGMQYFMARGESVHRGKQALELSEAGATSVHGGSSYWRMMRATAAALKWRESGGQDSSRYMRIMPRDESEREEQRKAARLALDTSAHASLEYQKILKQCASPFKAVDEVEMEEPPKEALKTNGSLHVPSTEKPAVNGHGPAQKLIPSPSRASENGEDGEERQVRGRHAYRQFIVDQDQRRKSLDTVFQGLESKQRSWSFSDMSLSTGKPQLSRKSLQLPIPNRNGSSDWKDAQPRSFPRSSIRSSVLDGDTSMGSSLERNASQSNIPDLPGMPVLKKVSFGSLDSRSIASSPGAGASSRGLDGSDRGRDYFSGLQDRFALSDPCSQGRSPDGSSKGKRSTAAGQRSGPIPAEGNHSQRRSSAQQAGDSGKSTAKPSSADPGKENARWLGTIDTQEMKELMRRLNFTKEAETVSEADLAEGLRQLGYQIRPHEVKILAEQVDLKNNDSGSISKSAFLASQIDWHQEDLRELWLEAAKKVFADFETASGGKISSAALTSIIRQKLPCAEVEYAVEDALVEAGYADEDEVDFDAFLRILRSENPHTLDQFEARLKRPSSSESLQSLQNSDASQHGLANPPGSQGSALPSVAE